VTGWQVLAVDDEPLALDELIHQLGQDPRIGVITSAADGIQALRLLQNAPFDVVFLDVNMPGLDGVELAGVLAGQLHRPVIVFVTAYEARAADAFSLDAADYVLKPLRAERLADALNRVERRLTSREDTAQPADDDLSMLAIDDGRRTFFIRREDVLYAEAHRDYVHLYTRGAQAGVHVVRMPLSELETRWREHGFLRVHRSYLIALRFVSELARDPLGGQLVRVGGRDLPVSRRQANLLRDRIRDLGRRGGLSREGQ
jgi:DNA-binding LytR/AlgR family response regulator